LENELKEERENRPRLQFVFEHLIFNGESDKMPSSQTCLAIFGIVFNKGSLPSSVIDWNFQVKLNGSPIRYYGHLVKETVSFEISSGMITQFREVDQLPIKTLKPIEPGGVCSGYMLLIVEKSDFRDGSGVEITVSFNDIFGNLTREKHKIDNSTNQLEAAAGLKWFEHGLR